ncbi:MAG: tetratricopeptide repeat protein [Sandaracinaceae bacterium]|nr:tetratricopeptide repeat protein [Sandaracinaceae bacterium]
MEAAAGGFAGSATARVRLGELSLRAQPPRAEEAARWFERALALHEQGCTLAFRDRWAALEGSALARMMQGDYAGALPFLRRSIGEWPDVRSTRYNLACALCQTGDVEGCARELRAVLTPRARPARAGWRSSAARPGTTRASRARIRPRAAPRRRRALRGRHGGPLTIRRRRGAPWPARSSAPPPRGRARRDPA